MDAPAAVAPDEPLEKRRRREAVRAVHARAGRLAHGVEAPDRRPALEVREDAAAEVVRRGHDGDRLGRDVDAELLAGRRDRREALPMPCPSWAPVVVGEVEVDARLAARRHLLDDGARHDVARGEVLAASARSAA